MFRFFESRIVAVKPDRRDYRDEHGNRDARAYPDGGDTKPTKPTKPQTTQTASAQKKWRFSKSCIVPALLLLASFASLIYPHAAMWLSQYHMSEVAAEYAKLITHAVPAPHEQLRRAREYNSKLSSGAIYEANTNIPTSHGATSDASQDYWDQLKVNDDGLMARLRIKKIDLDLPVYHGTEDATLLKGLGHLRGTSLPVGGKGTRSVITGHRGLASAEMFTRLDEVGKGDTFTIEVFDEILTYKVVDKIVVNPDETKKIAAVPGKDLMTLITCTPLGINTQRILVTGERVVPTPAADKALRGKKPDVPRFPWWIVACFGSLCIVGGYIWWAGLPVKKKKKTEKRNDDVASDVASDAVGDAEADAPAATDVNISAVGSAYRSADSTSTSTVSSADLVLEEAKAIENRPKKRPKVKKSSSRKKRKRSGNSEKTFDWLIRILGL
ncbi:class C sortase [Gardnerella sp. DNF01205]|uniref:class C sortase n=1 Tax=unclassified Gardnerella TaxID=2628112 RepID=UPI003BADA8E5|nr:class C sortase [Gardnerella leopoldii]